METPFEKEQDPTRKPGDLRPENTNKDQKRIDQEDDEDKKVILDIDKESFTERPHGRTTEPLGPGHEPGTI